MINEDDEQYAYSLTYNVVRMFGNQQQADRWGRFARDNWKYTNANKRGYNTGKKFLSLALMFHDKEDIFQVLVDAGLEPNPELVHHGQAPMAQLYGPVPHGPVHHGQAQNEEEH